MTQTQTLTQTHPTTPQKPSQKARQKNTQVEIWDSSPVLPSMAMPPFLHSHSCSRDLAQLYCATEHVYAPPSHCFLVRATSSTSTLLMFLSFSPLFTLHITIMAGEGHA